MPNRNRLPNRRNSETFEFEHDQLHYTASIGYDDSKPMEVFVNCRRLGTAADSSIRDAAIAISIALQYGACLETLARAMTRNADGKASSPIGKLLDLIHQMRHDTIG